MDLHGRHVVVTGAASGIGRALAERFAAEGARHVVVSDVNEAGALAVASGIGAGASAVRADVAREEGVVGLIDAAEAAHGPIDLFFSNAGIGGDVGGPEVPDDAWDEIWRINVMAHVWAARALLPRMTERGGGYLCSTASAAGLLTSLGVLTYSVTKHAAVGLAEWLSITYATQNIKVSCLCPQGVNTNMLDDAIGAEFGKVITAAGAVLEPADVAEACVQAIREERFLILPHPEVAGYQATKATQNERWLAGMRRFDVAVRGSAGSGPAPTA